MKPVLMLATPGLPPLEYHIQDFLNAKAATRDASTVAFYRNGLNQYARFVGARFWPPTDSSITAFLADCKRRDLSKYTIHDYYVSLRTWLRWLHKRGVLDKNPLDLVDEPPRPKKIPRAPEAQIIVQFFASIEACVRPDHLAWLRTRDRAIFSLLLDSGLRIGELVDLWLGDINLDRREILIRDPKNDEQRIVVFSDLARLELTAWLELRQSLNVPYEVQFVFVSKPSRYNRYQKLSDSGIRQAKDRYLDLAGLVRFRVHDLRHAYAIYTLMNQGNLADIQKQLGHKDIATTAIYLQAVEQGRAQRHDETSPLRRLRAAD